MRRSTRSQLSWRSRRTPLAWLLVLLGLTVHGSPLFLVAQTAPSQDVPGAQQASPGASRRGPSVEERRALEIESVGLTVSSLRRSVDFYTGTLGFALESEREVAGAGVERLQGIFPARARVARLRLGQEAIELTEYVTPRGRRMPEESRSNDRWFQHIAIVVSDMDVAYARLRDREVEQVSPEPQQLPEWNAAAAGIRALYFRDPDRHALEVIEYPPGKGDPRWQARDGRLFLGIDHTAIVVGDTDAALALYVEGLGLRVAGGSLNHGPEQERLNAVPGARLRITALRAVRGPGIELLEYLAPADGRAAPPDLQANDLAHWQTRLVVQSVSQAVERTRTFGGRLVSTGVAQEAVGSCQQLRAGALVRDRDGHGLQLVE